MSTTSRGEPIRRSPEKITGKTPVHSTDKASGHSSAHSLEPPSELHLLVGTYTQDTDSMGIYSARFDAEEPALTIEHTITRSPNPSFLALRAPLFFAAQEMPRTGAAGAYLLDADGSLAHLGSTSDSAAAGTCHVTLHPSGRWLYGANFESGTLSCWPVRLDGRLGPLHLSVRHEGHGPNCTRQEAPHIHSSAFLPKSDVLVAVDLGTDTLTLYRASKREGLSPEPLLTVHTPAGFGPRMVAFHPTLPFAAVIGELANRVLLYRLEQDGTEWTVFGTRDLPTRTGACNKAAHVAFSNDGKRLFASVRGRDAISVIYLDDKGSPSGKSCFPSGGKSPRHFSLSPCGRYLAVANTASGNVTIFGMGGDGTPEHSGPAERAGRTKFDVPEELCRIPIPHPSCVIWT